eukprot:scaffold846_cov252-Pinguiococcus_pyrenoidosus.AAC.7
MLRHTKATRLRERQQVAIRTFPFGNRNRTASDGAAKSAPFLSLYVTRSRARPISFECNSSCVYASEAPSTVCEAIRSSRKGTETQRIEGLGKDTGPSRSVPRCSGSPSPPRWCRAPGTSKRCPSRQRGQRGRP